MATGLLLALQELFVECTLILRVLAMYSFNRWVIFLLVTAVISSFSVAAWGVILNGPSVLKLPSLACILTASHHDHVREAVAWEALLAGDVLLLGLTLYRGYSRDRVTHAGSLWIVLVRDGAMYFVIISLMNFTNILMFYVIS
ncbi:hypothetical protein K438DRAFT_1836069 [Mycena galopus ATCC 62051]|nr:hypothetical protein K438DRAFT_1836069 [Mycena galopus ATCC 62051]